MKKCVIIIASFLLSVGAYAQKSEIRSIKRILDKEAPSDSDYKELQSLIDKSMPYVGNLPVEDQAEFYFLKGNYELQKAVKTSNPEAFSTAVESFNKIKSLEEGQKRKTYTDKVKESTKQLREQAIQKAIALQNVQKFREATQIFKALYDLDKDAMNLYYAANTAINIPDYNIALEYYQELLDLNFKGEYVYYTAVNKSNGELTNFGENKVLMDKLVKVGEYTNPKQVKEESKKPQIMKNMVLIYQEVNQHARAEKLLADARLENPKDVDLMIIQLKYFIQNNEMQKAENLIKQAIAIDSENYQLIHTLAQINAQENRIDEAKSLYERVLQINPNYADAHIGLGAIALADEDKYVNEMNAITGMSAAEIKKYNDVKDKRDAMYKKAIPHFENAHRIDPNNQVAISYLVGLYGALDMTEKHDEYKAKQKN